jgi:hypothetical protein
LPNTIADEGLTNKDDLFRLIKSTVSNILYSKSILYAGHFKLYDVFIDGTYRFSDSIFTTIREPMDRILSMVNYIIAVMLDDAEPVRKDTADWLELARSEGLKVSRSKKVLQELAHQILINDKFIDANQICDFLGAGDASSATDMIIRSNIEITDTKRYNAWLRTRWGVERSSRANSSKAILRRQDLSAAEISYVNDLCSEDYILYDKVLGHLERSKGPSIRGLVLGDT